MANTVEITKLIDGERNIIFHVFIESDGVSGDLTDTVLIDPVTDLDPALDSIPSMTIEGLQYDLSGFSAKLEFDYLIGGTPVWSLSNSVGASFDFSDFGGLRDRSGVLDGTGKLQITTSGLTALGDTGTIIIKVRK